MLYNYIRTLALLDVFECEYMFPWYNDLKMIRSENAYSPEAFRKLLELAKGLSMFIIPLDHTKLKYADFSHLRRDINSIRSICPINPGSLILVKKMVTQVTFRFKMVSHRRR